MAYSPDEMKAAASAYLAEREDTSGVPVPFVGAYRVLCVALMAGFACEVAANELRKLVGEPTEGGL